MNTKGVVKAMIPTKVPPIIPRAALFLELGGLELEAGEADAIILYGE